jgi:membrane protein implicated in regulation of membrane protease activity
MKFYRKDPSKSPENYDSLLRTILYAAVFPVLTLALLFVTFPRVHLPHPKSGDSKIPILLLETLAGAGFFLILFVLSLLLVSRLRRKKNKQQPSRQDSSGAIENRLHNESH